MTLGQPKHCCDDYRHDGDGGPSLVTPCAFSEYSLMGTSDWHALDYWGIQAYYEHFHENLRLLWYLVADYSTELEMAMHTSDQKLFKSKHEHPYP